MTYNLKDLLTMVQVIIIIFFEEYNLLYISVGHVSVSICQHRWAVKHMTCTDRADWKEGTSEAITEVVETSSPGDTWWLGHLKEGSPESQHWREEAGEFSQEPGGGQA